VLVRVDPQLAQAYRNSIMSLHEQTAGFKAKPAHGTLATADWAAQPDKYVQTRGLTMADLKLPADLIAFLQSGRQLDYDASKCECGSLRLARLEELKLETIWAKPSEFDADDPHAGHEGLYKVEAVDLVEYAEHYPPEFILLWLPAMECFGTWDSDHYHLSVFPNASWSDIAINPLPFIDSQWRLDGNGVAELARVWLNYSFEPGSPDVEDNAG
jgi:hypothetical protein